MMDLLILAPSNYEDPLVDDWHTDLRYTVSFLRARQFEVGLLAPPVLDPPDAIIDEILSADPRLLFVNLTEENILPVLKFLRALRSRSCKPRILAGGVPATLSGPKVLAACTAVDGLVAGEREQALLEVCSRLGAPQRWGEAPGLASRDFANPPAALITDLDALGTMARDGLEAMLAPCPPGQRVGHLMASRGCYGRCSFCGVPAFYGAGLSGSVNTWRGRSPAAVLDEMEGFIADYGIHYFVFDDDNFFGPGEAGQERVRQFALEKIRRNLPARFFFCCRVNDVQRPAFELLKAAGLEGVGIGVESTCPDSLRLFRKGYREKDIRPALDLLKALRVRSEINLIFFDPYLTLAGVRENLAFLETVRKEEWLVYSTAFPFNELRAFAWSPVAQTLSAEGLLNDADGTLRYRDARVGRLAAWAREVRAMIPVTFKQRYFFKNLPGAITADVSAEARAEILKLAAGFRLWTGLYLFPRYVAKACDILEHEDGGAEPLLDALGVELIREVERNCGQAASLD